MNVCLVNLILFYCSCFSRNTILTADTASRNTLLSGTVPAAGMSKQEQFNQVLSWFSSFRAANFEVIETGDPAAGMIRADGSVESPQTGAASRNGYKTRFTLLIRLLGGAYRYELSRFSVIPFRKGRYCPERATSVDASGILSAGSRPVRRYRRNRSYYQEAGRIAGLIIASISNTLSGK